MPLSSPRLQFVEQSSDPGICAHFVREGIAAACLLFRGLQARKKRNIPHVGQAPPTSQGSLPRARRTAAPGRVASVLSSAARRETAAALSPHAMDSSAASSSDCRFNRCVTRQGCQKLRTLQRFGASGNAESRPYIWPSQSAGVRGIGPVASRRRSRRVSRCAQRDCGRGQTGNSRAGWARAAYRQLGGAFGRSRDLRFPYRSSHDLYGASPVK
jgi:hypothetical protein